MENDDEKVPSWSPGSSDIHERIRPLMAEPGGEECPLKVGVGSAPENDVADAEPRKSETVQGKLGEEKKSIHSMHIHINERMASSLRQHERH